MNAIKGYVYTFTGNADDLARLARKYLGERVWHWVADPAHLDVREDYPEDWKGQGAVFNEKGELRWQREESSYQALLLTEAPIEGLTSLPGEWTVDVQTLFLQDLEEPKLNPQFVVYPTSKPKGHLVVHLYRREGMPLFLSLRKFEEE